LNIVGVIHLGFVEGQTSKLGSTIAAAVSSDELTLPRIWKYERKARDYMSLYCFIHNIDEKEKDLFEKIEKIRKLVKKKRCHPVSWNSSLGP
jgi:hypothetical protein